jgi:hypothetical protein
MNNSKIQKNKNEKLYLTATSIKQHLIQDFIPISLTTSVLAPLNRMKIILQLNPMISIIEVEKTRKTTILFRSMIYI